MLGLAMDRPLLLSRLIDHAAQTSGSTEVVGRTVEDGLERTSYAALQRDALRLAKALTRRGLAVDGLAATILWNTVDHVRVYYGVLGLGAALHTINPRLSAEHLVHMINEVGDQVVFVDADTVRLVDSLRAQTPTVRDWVYLDRDGSRPPQTAGDILLLSDLLDGVDDDFTWPTFDERQAATICYTSGTTGLPKGVVYSHRSVMLNAMLMSMADMYGGYQPGDLEVVMPIAPLFHSNGWNMPFTAPMNGHKLVLPGRAFDPVSLVELIRAEGVTVTGAVPTVWSDMFAHLRAAGETVPALRVGLVAGTRPPTRLFAEFEHFGVRPCQTWGMTEAPGVTRASPPPGSSSLPAAERDVLARERQGRVAFLLEHRLLDEDGRELPHDGKARGRMEVRGPVASARYLSQAADEASDWLDTGDMAVIHPDGAIEIVDRVKDVIKSGGEWISTLQLEAAATSHPAVEQAAAISMPHPRWQERPFLLCTLTPGGQIDEPTLREHMAQTVAKWWLPDKIAFIDSMPLTPTGKISKVQLRQLYDQREEQLVV